MLIDKKCTPLFHLDTEHRRLGRVESFLKGRQQRSNRALRSSKLVREHSKINERLEAVGLGGADSKDMVV